MDAEGLSRDFSSQVSFCGGVDAQHLLVNGSPSDIRRCERGSAVVHRMSSRLPGNDGPAGAGGRWRGWLAHGEGPGTSLGTWPVSWDVVLWVEKFYGSQGSIFPRGCEPLSAQAWR